MAQPSFEFALGRISVLSTHLLSASQLRRIAEAGSTKEAQKLLLETGYGEMRQRSRNWPRARSISSSAVSFS